MKTLMSSLGILMATAVLAPALAQDAAPKPPMRSEIDFANHGGIWDWRADGTGAILIKSRSSHYYRATFFSPCFGLPFRTGIAFVTDSRDVLDQYGGVDVGDQHCTFDRFTEIPKPGKW